jgi:tryptophan-rich sensory protein
MSQSAAEWISGAIMATALAIVSFALGMVFLPAGSKAYEDGTFVPWVLAWGMIWTAILAALALAAFLIVSGLKPGGARGR